MLASGGGRPQHRAETARVVVTKDDSVGEFQVDVIVGAPRRCDAVDAKASGHPEMDDQRVGTEAEKQVFAAPVDPVDDATDQPAGQIAWNRPA
jgi:hypothetical protein